MSQEVVIVRYCDVCQKDQKVKTPDFVETYTITVNGFTREVDVCANHRDADISPLGIESLRDFLSRYGRKPLADITLKSEKEPSLTPKDNEDGEWWCQCGRRFVTERRLNMHVGQQVRQGAAEGEHVLSKRPKKPKT